MHASKKIGRILCVISAVYLCISLGLADILICPHCGYECGEGVQICGHCKANLPGEEKKAPDSDDVVDLEKGKDGRGFLNTDIVDSEMAMGQMYFKKANMSLGRLFFRNAAALDMLTNPESGSSRSMKITKAIRSCESLARSFRRKCSICEGSGKASMLNTSFSGESTYKKVHGRLCRNCQGKGYVFGIGTVDERKAEIGRGLREYVRLQKGRKFSPVGQAWIPMSLEGSLSQRQTALLMRTVAFPCSACMGIGMVDCGRCRGTGQVKCKAHGCVGGIVESVLKSSLMKNGIKCRKKCKTCAGTGMQTCETCTGKGNVLCRRCNGTGERPVCSKCAGQGMAPCSHCKGTGVYRDGNCVHCGGGGTVLCRTCNGDGKRK
ncbi:MAG: hypothetical protein KAH23_05120 [Kiritimatiellae bacterium]|nr:hypothetical protein [Kiritimatiellia bacterium]